MTFESTLRSDIVYARPYSEMRSFIKDHKNLDGIYYGCFYKPRSMRGNLSYGEATFHERHPRYLVYVGLGFTIVVPSYWSYPIPNHRDTVCVLTAPPSLFVQELISKYNLTPEIRYKSIV